MRADQLDVYARRGIILQPDAVLLKDGYRSNPRLAMDAQSDLITTPNTGIPAFLANLIDPQTVKILYAPTKAAEIYGEVKRGDWTTITSQFPVMESTGEVSSYGDYSNDGSVGSNYNWVPRQSYHVQTISQYGDRETEMFGLAQINYVSDLNFAAALLLNKWLNKMYFFGVRNMANVGGLNDPNLLPPITPTTKEATGATTTWGAATAVEVYNDFLLLFTQLQTQLMGTIERSTPMTLALSPKAEPGLGKVTAYTLAPVREAIMKEFPALKIISAPEFSTSSGELVQLIVDEIDGVKTAYCGFTEKLRTGRVVADLSSYKQKKVAGGWGTIIRRPVAIAQMLGI